MVEPRQSSQAPVQAVQQRIYQAAMKQAHYLLGTVHPWSEDPGLLLLTESRSAEHWIRPNAGAIEGFAFLARFGPYDESTVGVSRKRLSEETILPMMRYLVTTHVTGSCPTGDGKKWGDAWQSAHWAHMLGRGAWWIWPDLPGDVRAGIRRVVAHEADRIAATLPPHNLQKDTKAEENAWNSQILSVAVLLMPDDPRRTGWETAFQKWVLSSFLRPADAKSEAIVDGRPVAEQFTGANIYDDFTLENHGFVHPDYMTAISLSLGSAVDYALSARRPPAALLYNVSGIYENLKWFVLPDGGFVYPNGQDWELFRNPIWLYKHVLMAVYVGDPDAWSLALRSLATMERMQARSPSGAVYGEGEYFFPSCQHDLLVALAMSWLALETERPITTASGQDRLGVRRLDAARIILHRTPSAVHTLSWGAKIMAQCVPFGTDRIVSPHQENGIGHVLLRGGKRPLPVSLHDAQVTQTADGFEARLVVDHGRDVRAVLHFRSVADGTWAVREELTAIRDTVTTEVATGLVGILNNPHWVYERGLRQARLDAVEEIIPALSGKRFQSDLATKVLVESALEIRSLQPLRVRYVGAKESQRGRATDELYLNVLDGERTWTAGEKISTYEATIRCVRQPPTIE